MSLAAVWGGICSGRPQPRPAEERRSISRAIFSLIQHLLVELEERRVIDRVFPLNPHLARDLAAVWEGIFRESRLRRGGSLIGCFLTA